MRALQTLWLLTVATSPENAEIYVKAFDDSAVAVTVLAPPRKATATVEAIYQQEPDHAEIASKLAVLSAVYGVVVPKFTIHQAPALDWLKKVASDFPPVKIARWTVHGAVHRHKVSNRLFALQIDATSAFGTGEHPTTRGCLLMLNKILKSGFRPRNMADIGCGSGILAMGCVQGWRRCRAIAVDMDQDSVLIARHNARINGFSGKINAVCSRGYVSPELRRAAPYDLIMANIFAGPLSEMAKDLKKNLRPGGVAILSGLLNAQAKRVITAHRAQGLVLTDHMIIGEWSVLALRRPNRA